MELGQRIDFSTCVGQTATVSSAVKEGTEKHRLYHCAGRREERNNMSDEVRSYEWKDNWKRQRGLPSCPKTSRTWRSKQAVETKVVLRNFERMGQKCGRLPRAHCDRRIGLCARCGVKCRERSIELLGGLHIGFVFSLSTHNSHG